MRICISTKVDLDYLSVKEQFNDRLLQKLSPPFPKVTILRFDGSMAGDRVIMELDFLVFKQVWEGEIVQDYLNEQEFCFIDVGVKLPFFLKSWRHTHRLLNRDDKTIIRDEIEFTSGYKAFDFLLYPAMLMQFLYRKPIYKKLLSKQRALA